MPYKFNPFTGGLDYYEAGAAGANTSLSNLSSTNFNEDISTTGSHSFISGDGAALIEMGIQVPGLGNVPGVGSSTNLYLAGTTNLTAIAGSGSLINQATLGNATMVAGGVASLQGTTRVELLSSTGDIDADAGNNSAADATDASNVDMKAGDKTAGTGNGGDIILTPGTSVGGRAGYVYANGNIRYGYASYGASAGTFDLSQTASVAVIDGSTNAVTLTLPTAAGRTGAKYTIHCTDATNAPVIDGNGSETINGATTYTINNDGETVEIISDGTNWFIVNQNTINGGSGSITTLTWNSSAPLGTLSGSYEWEQTGNNVDLWFWFDYSGAAASNSFVYFSRPSSVPTPVTRTANSLQVTAVGAGGLGNGGGLVAPVSAQYFPSSDRFYLYSASALSCNEGHGHIRYQAT